MKLAQALSYRTFVASMDFNKVTDENIHLRPKTAIIEVMGEQDLGMMPFYFKRDHPNVLRLLFDDVQEDLNIYSIGHPDDDEREYFKVITMSKEQGKQIVDFVRANKDVINFVIHCAAGISRSGSIARFIMEFTSEEGENSDEKFHHHNPHCIPKAGFMKTLRDAAQDSLGHGEQSIKGVPKV